MIQENKTLIKYELPILQDFPDFLVLLGINGINLSEEQRNAFLSVPPTKQHQVYLRLIEKKFTLNPNSSTPTCSGLNSATNTCNFKHSECTGTDTCKTENPLLHATFLALNEFNGEDQAK